MGFDVVEALAARFIQKKQTGVRTCFWEDLLVSKVNDFAQVVSFRDQLSQRLAVLRLEELVGHDESHPVMNV